MNDEHKNLLTECQLEDGSIVPYDAAAPSQENPPVYIGYFYPIGKGVIYAIGGQRTYDDRPFWFFRRLVSKHA